MKKPQPWFKEYASTIMVLLLVPILIMVSIMFWFYTDAYLIWNPDNFNNIATPIAAIVSGVLLFFAIMQTNKQNKLAMSQTVKVIYQERYDHVAEKMKKDKNELVRAIADHKRTNIRLNQMVINSINYMDEVRKALERIVSNQEYKNDLERHYAHLPIEVQAHHRSYHQDLEFVFAFAEHPTITNLDMVYDLLIELRQSDLIPLEVDNFKLRIKTNLLDRYFANLNLETDIMLPVLYNHEDEWINFNDSGIRKYYDFFKKEID